MKLRRCMLALVAALATAQPRATLAGEAGESGPRSQTSDPFTLDVTQAKLENVLRLIAKQYDLNLVAGKDVTGSVTVHLHGVTMEEALDAVLRPNGFEYEKKGNLLEVRPIAPQKPAEPTPELPAPKPITKFIPLRYANGKDLVETMKALVPKGSAGVFEYNLQRNAFLIQDSPEAVERIEELLHELDQKLVQVRIEAKIVETLLGEHDHLGIDWATSIRLNGASRPVTFPFPQDLKGGPFFPITNKEGVVTSINTSTSTSSSRNASFFDSRSGFPLAQPIDFTLGHLDATQFSAVLELLQASTETKLVASPEVTTLDNQQAKITIGQTIPIPTYTRNEERGTTTVSGYEKLEVGTTLLVTPRVNDEKTITLYLKPEVSEVTGYRGPLQEFPQTETRSAETTVVLEDGKTLVIGGLVRERTFQKTSKFPLLGDIPIIGYLFRYQAEDKEKSNLLIFITPHIVDSERTEAMQRGMAMLDGQWVPSEAAARVTKLRAALASADSSERASAAAALGIDSGEVVRKALKPAEALDSMFWSDPSAEVRAAALVSLGAIAPDRVQSIAADPRILGEPDAASPLALATLREPSMALRWLLAKAASSASRGEAIRRFQEGLRSPDPTVRARAVDALSEIADPSLVEGIVPLVSDPDPLVAVATLRALTAANGATPDGIAPIVPPASIARLALGSRDEILRPAATWAGTALSQGATGERPRASFPAEASACTVEGDGAGVLKVKQALDWLAEKSPRDAHLVRFSTSGIVVGDGPTRVHAGRVQLSSRDASTWPIASLAHELVHLASHAFLQRTAGALPCAVEEALAFEQELRAVHAIAGDAAPSREALVDFVRKAVQAAGSRSEPAFDPEGSQ